MHNGLTTSLSSYSIKYLNEFFVPYGSSLKTNILLTSMSSILVTFLLLYFFTFFHFLSPKFTLFLLIVIIDEKKRKTFFIMIGCMWSDHIFYCTPKLIIFQQSCTRHNGLLK